VASADGSTIANQWPRPKGRLASAASQVSMGGLEETSPSAPYWQIQFPLQRASMT